MIVVGGCRVFEIGDQAAGRPIDTKEVVAIEIGSIGLRSSLGQERNGGNATRSSACGYSCAGAFEPQLDGERLGSQRSAVAEGDVLAGRAVELKGFLGLP